VKTLKDTSQTAVSLFSSIMPPRRKKQTAGTKKVAANEAGTNNDGTSTNNNELVKSLQTADEEVNWRSCVAKMVLYKALSTPWSS